MGIAGGGSKYPYKPFWGEFSPRVSIAWNPDFGSGTWLGKIFGHKNTVIRAGYGRFYTKNLGIDLVSTPVLGDGFLQPVSCVNPSSIRGMHADRRRHSRQCLPHRRGRECLAVAGHHPDFAVSGSARREFA